MSSTLKLRGGAYQSLLQLVSIVLKNSFLVLRREPILQYNLKYLTWSHQTTEHYKEKENVCVHVHVCVRGVPAHMHAHSSFI